MATKIIVYIHAQHIILNKTIPNTFLTNILITTITSINDNDATKHCMKFLSVSFLSINKLYFFIFTHRKIFI